MYTDYFNYYYSVYFSNYKWAQISINVYNTTNILVLE